MDSFVKIVLLSLLVCLVLMVLAKLPGEKPQTSKFCLSRSQLNTLVSEIKSLMEVSKQDQNPVYSLLHINAALCKLQLLSQFGPQVEKIYQFDMNQAKSTLQGAQEVKIKQVQYYKPAQTSVVPDALNFYG